MLESVPNVFAGNNMSGTGGNGRASNGAPYPVGSSMYYGGLAIMLTNKDELSAEKETSEKRKPL